MGAQIEIAESNQGKQSQPVDHQLDGKAKEDASILRFLDSLDGYLRLQDSLASSLRQAWLELASARHSMGAFRINSAMLDLKSHQAATQVVVTDNNCKGQYINEPCFTLRKWASVSDKHSEGAEDGEDKNQSPAEMQDERSLSGGGSPLPSEEQVQKERQKSVAVFGGLVSPKLKDAQLSFETALETLVEIASTRSTMLAAFEHLQRRD